MTEISTELAAKRDRLLELLRSYGSCAVAFSGGLDSTVLAKAAQLGPGRAGRGRHRRQRQPGRRRVGGVPSRWPGRSASVTK